MSDHIVTLGGQTIKQREIWVENIFERVKDLVADFTPQGITTCNSLCVTNLINSYVRGQLFPFINIPIRYHNQELLGLYEYFADQLPLHAKHIYCDVVVQPIYYAEHLTDEALQALEARLQNGSRLAAGRCCSSRGAWPP
jgi:hypothetical protein